MNTKNIYLKTVTSADLYKYSVSELVYIFLSVFQMTRGYDINNPDHQALLHTDFLDYIKETKYTLGIQQFVRECKYYWRLVPDYSEELTNFYTKYNINDLPLFSYYYKSITNTKPCRNINLLQLYEVIKNPKYFEKQTNELRRIADKTQRANFKQTQLDFVLFSGIFPPYKRNSQSCEKPSGYLCIDIDHVKTDMNELKKKLIADSALDVQLLFVSPSGDGFKMVIPYDLQEFPEFLEFYQVAETHFLELYKLQIDKACKNIDRACFICFDNDVFINPKILI